MSAVTKMDNENNSCEVLISQNDDESSSVRCSIAERRAAKCGFNADRIRAARFRAIRTMASPARTICCSPFITIPPGISPTSLLDSPMFLPNSQISPTTGTFPSAFLDFESSVMNAMLVEPSLKRKSNEISDPLIGFSSIKNQDPVLGKQSMDFEFSTDLRKKDDDKSCTDELATDAKVAIPMVTEDNLNGVQMPCSDVASDQPSQLSEQVNGDNRPLHHTVEEHNGMYQATGNGRNSEDGYNWRKYGQKQVKGSEYPRSYYKCTQPTCPVKKKIERSHDGQITEIIYKGAHNHPKPQFNRRAQLGSSSSLDEMPETDGGSGNRVKVESRLAWKDMELGRADGLERSSSASVVTDLSDHISATQGKSLGTFESDETPELSSTLASCDDDDEDQATRGSVSPRGDANDDESDSKRRKIEGCYMESNLASRAIREPKVVVQIESEVDILDDGYRWRKYGQKVVKGNPNPRSYYKCTSAGCSVRKHVERASHNLKYVITTYEGKHNHEVPAARNSTNVNTGVNLNQATANQQPPFPLAKNTTVSKPEIQLQDFIPGFDRKPMFHSDYFSANFPGNIASDMKLGTSSIYPMKLPSMPNTMAYCSFGFNSSLVPEFRFTNPTSLHTYPSFPLGSTDFSNGNSIGQVQGFLSGQQLIRPKQEQKDDSSYDHGMCGNDHLNASSSSASSIYHQIRGNFSS